VQRCCRSGYSSTTAERLTAVRRDVDRPNLEALVARHDRMIDAAAAAGSGRVYLYKLMVKPSLRGRDD
jgi:hypothetical protein